MLQPYALMENRFIQFCILAMTSLAMGWAALQALPELSAKYFYPLIISRLVLAGAIALLALYVQAEKDKRLSESSMSLVFLVIALSEAFQSYLQANVVGLSYLIVCVALALGSSLSFLTLSTSLLSLLPSQLSILAVPFLTVPLETWSDRVQATRVLALPLVTLGSSSLIWLLNSIYVYRQTTSQKVTAMARRQELLQAQLLLLRKQPTSMVLPQVLVEEKIRARSDDSHATDEKKSISDEVALNDLLDLLRSAVNAVKELNSKKSIRIALDLPAPMELPISIAAERSDLENIFRSALAKSAASLNKDHGVVRVAARVGYKAVSITIEDNGWGLREKFSDGASSGLELSLREIQGVVGFWGGRFEVMSRLGVGSRMAIELNRIDSFVTESEVNEQQDNPASHITTGS